eukprot:m.12411 g.12411  ORF g.12411 m.12411 type:complete len:448 (+) comp4251_c0_seq2:141-1484(+)
MPNGTPNRLAKRGWLVKRGQVRKNWKRRFMVLDPQSKTLAYHEDSGDLSNPKGVVQLDGASRIDSAACRDEVGKDHAFGVVTSGRVFYFVASDARECTDWYDKIGVVIRQGGAPRGRPQPAGGDVSHQPQARGGMGRPAATATAAGHSPQRHPQTHPQDQHQATGGTRSRPGARGGTGRVQVAGETNSLTAQFQRLRGQQRMAGMEIERLKTRVGKILLSPNCWTSGRDKLIQSVVPWQPDADVAACPFCQREFNMMSNRRTHCQLCGKVVCGRRGCTDPISLSRIGHHLGLKDSLPRNKQDVQQLDDSDAIRVCSTCEGMLNASSRQARIESGKGSQTPLERLMQLLTTTQQKVEILLPKYHAAASQVKDGVRSSEPEAMKLRQDLKQLFEQVNAIGVKIERLPTGPDPEQQDARRAKLQANIRQAIMQWYQPRSFTLQALDLDRR